MAQPRKYRWIRTALTEDEFDVQFSDVFDQIVAYNGGKPIHVINPEVLNS